MMTLIDSNCVNVLIHNMIMLEFPLYLSWALDIREIEHELPNLWDAGLSLLID